MGTHVVLEVTSFSSGPVFVIFFMMMFCLDIFLEVATALHLLSDFGAPRRNLANRDIAPP